MRVVRAIRAQQHGVPAEQGRVRHRLGIGAMQINHHLRHTLFSRANFLPGSGKAELTADGGLHAGAIQYLAFNF